MELDINYLKKFIIEIFNIDSPSGFTGEIIKRLVSESEKLGLKYNVTNKGSLTIEIEGESKTKLGLAVHVDTLGLMVRSITDSTLKLTSIGSPIIPTLDGEYCKIYTRNNNIYTGTILSTSPAAHVFKDASTLERNIDNIEVRLDEKINCKQDIKNLGINNGDFVCYDPKTTITESGFVKSRFLDDKINVASLFTYIKYLIDNNIKPKQTLKLFFTTYEEVGHGGSTISDVDELIAIDMGCIGKDLDTTEYTVSICAKDSSGPYDYDLTTRLIKTAENSKLNYAVDIYPFYSSDASTSLRAGIDVKTALIGPGVSASHGMERTHLDGIINTIQLIISYTTL